MLVQVSWLRCIMPPQHRKVARNLKIECGHRQEFARRDQAQAAAFDYIETFYNRGRLHSALGYKSPVDFEQQTN